MVMFGQNSIWKKTLECLCGDMVINAMVLRWW